MNWNFVSSLPPAPGVSWASTGTGSLEHTCLVSRSRVSVRPSLTSLLASASHSPHCTPHTRLSSVQPHPWPCSLAHHQLQTASTQHIIWPQNSRIFPRPQSYLHPPLVLVRVMKDWLQCEAVWGLCRPVTGVCWLWSWPGLGTQHSGLRWASRYQGPSCQL